MKNINLSLDSPGCMLLGGVPQGIDARLLCQMVEHQNAPLLFIACNDVNMDRMAQALAFFRSDMTVLQFPAWDCMPFDRASPSSEVIARRLDVLTRLLNRQAWPNLILTTVAAVLQRVPARDVFRGRVLVGKIGSSIAIDHLVNFLERNGYVRMDTVMEPGEYALRGGIADLYPTGSQSPLRIDFFGDDIDDIRLFDPLTQRTIEKASEFVIKPANEVIFDDTTVRHFRTGYRELVGQIVDGDLLYESVSVKRRVDGVEHWLPLFHTRMETLLDYIRPAAVILDYQVKAAINARIEQIMEHYQARLAAKNTKEFMSSGPPYNPLLPERLYIGRREWNNLLHDKLVIQLSPFQVPEGPTAREIGGKIGKRFADAHANPNMNIFDALNEHLKTLTAQGKCVIISATTVGARERLAHVLSEHGLTGFSNVEGWIGAQNLPQNVIGLVIAGFEHGFETEDLAVVTEQDLFGDYLTRPAKKRHITAENFISEASSLSEGDLLVHIDHGIGRYDGLETLNVANAAHDCLRLIYRSNDKLFVPVENIETLSRFGSATAGVQLDRLGGAGWQARKAKFKKRIQDIAKKLIETAAARHLKKADNLIPPEGLYEEFCAKFPYMETEDQLKAVSDTLEDLAKGRPMDRLICGDVGFGKTEIALRAAFTAVLTGKQVAVVVPTTLLCRQHYKTFSERFVGLPVKVRQLSRLVSVKEAKDTKVGLKDGTVDIIIGTHTLLAKSIMFHDLNLLVIDEEQHFGVRHKERLKQLKSDVHVLTLSATPIPRTLQLALSGVRELSLIATPPVDRLAVRTFIIPEDPVVLRKAILREHFRGGQVFYVCPRIKDLFEQAKRLAHLVPEINLVLAHGGMAPKALEEAMIAFTNGHYNLLLCTNIIESGLDLPAVNTIIVHRADMFGLAQLYQLRGRVGRSKKRAYAYLMLPSNKKLTAGAIKRLEVMQTLDTLGAGFTLASYDLDIRGAGNLLGKEQSGHIREVGIELYQQMLEEAVTEIKGTKPEEEHYKREWSPQINISISVLLPDTYVPDLGVRLALYRRLGSLEDEKAVETFAIELIDRFGKLPEEAENLLQTVIIKQLCRKANIATVDAGSKGAVIGFRDNQFPNPAGLVAFITEQAGTAKLRPDHKIVFCQNWKDPGKRLIDVKKLIHNLAQVAQETPKA